MKMKKWAFLCVFVVLTFFSRADYGFRNLNTLRGLSSEVVYAICQDSNGELWVGTKTGLNRFTGHAFVNVPFRSKHYKSEGSKMVNAIIKHPNGDIWVATVNGVVRILAKNNKQIHYSIPCSLPILNYQSVTSMALSRRGKLWVGTQNGLFYFNTKTKKFHRYKFYAYESKTRTCNLKERWIQDLLFDKKDNLYVATKGNGFYILDLHRRKKVNYKHNSIDYPNCLNNNTVNCFALDKNDNVYIGTSNGLNVFNYTNDSFSVYKKTYASDNCLSDNKILSLAIDAVGDVMISTRFGLDILKPSSGVFYHYISNPLDKNTLSSNTINSIFVDDKNTKWFATHMGVNYSDVNNLHFDLFQNIPGDKTSLSDNVLRAIVSKGKYLWLGTQKDGVCRYDPYTQLFKSYKLTSKIKNVKKYNSIHCLFVDDNDDLIAGCDLGLLKYNSKLDKFQPYVMHTKLKFTKGIYSVLKDSKQNYWFSEINVGIWRYNKKLKSFNIIKDSTSIIKNLECLNIKSIFEHSNGDLWFINHLRGLSRLKPNTNKFITYKSSDKKIGLSSNSVYVIFEDSKKRLWFGTSKGLNVYNSSTNKFSQISLENGLQGDVILSIEEDNKGRLWLGTNKGLCCYDVDNELFSNFSRSDGLQANIFERLLSNKDANGLMYFGGNNGLNVFMADSLVMNTNLYKPRILSVRTPSKSYRMYNTDLSNFSVSVDDQKLTFYLSALPLSNLSKCRYKYRIKELDKSWTVLDPNVTKFRLDLLKEGVYTIEILASNINFLWNKKPFVMTLHVNKAYPKLIFVIPIFIIICLGFYYSILYYNRNKDKSSTKPEVLDIDVSEFVDDAKLLQNLVLENKLYTDKSITKAKLASKLDWSDAHLSNVLRHGLDSSYNDFVNYYRVEEVKIRLQDPLNKNYTLLGIADDSGFNSKTSFYRIFKKFTGLTPSEYVDNFNK